MKKLYRILNREEKGFTLVELLIVVIILAVLSGIAIPSYMTLRNRARTSATENEMKNIATALELYHADNEVYPAELLLLQGEGDNQLGPYMANVPEDDAWGLAYEYTPVADGGEYTLHSPGGDITMINGAFSDGVADGGGGEV